MTMVVVINLKVDFNLLIWTKKEMLIDNSVSRVVRRHHIYCYFDWNYCYWLEWSGWWMLLANNKKNVTWWVKLGNQFQLFSYDKNPASGLIELFNQTSLLCVWRHYQILLGLVDSLPNSQMRLLDFKKVYSEIFNRLGNQTVNYLFFYHDLNDLVLKSTVKFNWSIVTFVMLAIYQLLW